MSYWFTLYFHIHVDEKNEKTMMICLHIARQKSDRRYLACVDITWIQCTFVENTLLYILLERCNPYCLCYAGK